ncbi:MAG: hypothetical protein Kow0013_19630 [Pararhodobacter sp.]
MSDSASPLDPGAAPARDVAALLAARGLGGLERAGRDAAGRAEWPALAVLPQMALARGRLHEATGAARRTLAALVAGAAQAEGPVLWLVPRWRAGGLCPQGLARFMPDPGALITVGCPTAVDILWAMEEALRAGCVALVVAEIAETPDLRQVRRLHRAATEGCARAAQTGVGPLGLVCAQDHAESRVAGVESRWALHPLPPVPEAMAQAPRWRLERQLARGLPPRDWVVDLPDRGRAVARDAALA